MQEQFLPYELALKLKELGFNEECIATFDEDENFELQDFEQNYDTFPSHIIAVPLWQQAFEWFEEKYDFHINIFGDGFNGELKGFYYSITEEGWINYYESIDSGKWYDTKEEARQACLEKLIEICKKK